MYLGGARHGHGQTPSASHISFQLHFVARVIVTQSQLALENLAVLLKRDRLSENLCILEACCDWVVCLVQYSKYTALSGSPTPFVYRRCICTPISVIKILSQNLVPQINSFKAFGHLLHEKNDSTQVLHSSMWSPDQILPEECVSFLMSVYLHWHRVLVINKNVSTISSVQILSIIIVFMRYNKKSGKWLRAYSDPVFITGEDYVDTSYRAQYVYSILDAPYL